MVYYNTSTYIENKNTFGTEGPISFTYKYSDADVV